MDPIATLQDDGFQGRLRCYLDDSSLVFAELAGFFDSLENRKDYDFMVNFFMNKKNLWNLAFYTAKSDVDVSKIAAQFGGGGHAKAAGASSLKELPEFLLKGKPWSKPAE